MSAKKLGFGLLVGLVLALVLFPSAFVLAWSCGRHGSINMMAGGVSCGKPASLGAGHEGFGEPLDAAGWFYDPRNTLLWWRKWGGHGWFLQTSAIAGLIMASPFMLCLPFMIKLPHRKPGPDDLDDGFGTVRSLKRIDYIATNRGQLVLGDAGGGKVLCARGDRHMLVLGPSGTGKDAGHVIPSLLLDQGSALVFDPKRELDEITARRRREFGDVHVLDLADPRLGSASFNPFDVIGKGFKRQDFEVEDCALIAHLLAFQQGDDDKGGKSARWSEAAAKMLTAGALHVSCSDDRTLSHLRRWVQKVMERQYPEPNHDYTGEAIIAHEALANDTRASVNFNLDSSTSFLTYGKSVEKATCESSFDPCDLMCGDRPMTVYLTVPPSHRKSLRALQRLMLTMLVHPLKQNRLRAADDRQKVRPMTLHAVEFTTMGKIDLFATDIKDLRDFGFRYVLSTQGIEDIKDVYGENNPIVLNSQVIVAIPGFGEKTNKLLIEVCGKKWITTRSISKKPGLFQIPTRSESERQIDVLDLSGAQDKALTESLVLVRGAKPTWLKRALYHEHPAFRRMYDNQDGSELLRV